MLPITKNYISNNKLYNYFKEKDIIDVLPPTQKQNGIYSY